MQPRERAQKFGNKKQGMPDGKAKETAFPKANPGQLPYHRPRNDGPKIRTNES